MTVAERRRPRLRACREEKEPTGVLTAVDAHHRGAVGFGRSAETAEEGVGLDGAGAAARGGRGGARAQSAAAEESGRVRARERAGGQDKRGHRCVGGACVEVRRRYPSSLTCRKNGDATFHWHDEECVV